MNFKDNFSQIASQYAKYRPHYPISLFEYLSSLVTHHEKAWDCATGNGQAAMALTPYFDQIIATDASQQQLTQAVKHNKILYSVSLAEEKQIETATIDLITVAQALHWFNFELFYQEVKRVLKPNGIIAIWTYNLPCISPPIDALVKNFHDNIVGTYWQAENRLVENGYSNIPFPFEEIDSPAFNMTARWNFDNLIGHISTWSAVQRFQQSKGFDAMDIILADLRMVWGNSEDEKNVLWPLILRVGRNPTT